MIAEKLDIEKRMKRSKFRSPRRPSKGIPNPGVLDYKIREF